MPTYDEIGPLSAGPSKHRRAHGVKISDDGIGSQTETKRVNQSAVNGNHARRLTGRQSARSVRTAVDDPHPGRVEILLGEGVGGARGGFGHLTSVMVCGTEASRLVLAP